MDISSKAGRISAFTLIELLIVVAIIAILAAIAVPNFLEAQVRAKISRVKSDMRTVGTGMESYFVDNNSYPNDSDNNKTERDSGQNGLLRLTSPIAFLMTVPGDPFAPSQEDGMYELGSGADNEGWDGYCKSTGKAVQTWLLISPGPDAVPGEEDDTKKNDQWPFTTECFAYDASNGTKSDGDIYRVGGSYSMGTYTVNGVLRGQFPN